MKIEDYCYYYLFRGIIGYALFISWLGAKVGYYGD